MGVRNPLELRSGLGEGDIEGRLPPPHPFEQELKRQRRLAGSGITLHEIEAIPRQTAADEAVHTFDSGAAQVCIRRGSRSTGHVKLFTEEWNASN